MNSLNFGKRSQSYERRMHNIQWIRDFVASKKDYAYQTRELQMLLRTLPTGERLVLQWPGKESVREDDKKNPFDFRPKVIGVRDEAKKDLSFDNVWGILDSNKEILGDKKLCLQLLTTA